MAERCRSLTRQSKMIVPNARYKIAGWAKGDLLRDKMDACLCA